MLFLMRSPLYPYSLSFTRPASSPECSENRGIPFNGIPPDKKTWPNMPGPFWLHFSISFQPYPPYTPDTVIDEICPVLSFLSLHGLSFLPHPPAQMLPFLRSQLTCHFKKASHLYKKPLTPCWEILYEFVEWTDEQWKKQNFLIAVPVIVWSTGDITMNNKEPLSLPSGSSQSNERYVHRKCTTT